MLENPNTKLVLFDLDGTLIDTAPDFLSSLNNVLTRYNKRNVSASGIRTYISEGSSKLIKYAFDIDEKDKDFKKYKNEFLLEYKSNLVAKSNLFDGIEKLLSYLKDKLTPRNCKLLLSILALVHTLLFLTEKAGFATITLLDFSGLI